MSAKTLSADELGFCGSRGRISPECVRGTQFSPQQSPFREEEEGSNHGNTRILFHVSCARIGLSIYVIYCYLLKGAGAEKREPQTGWDGLWGMSREWREVKEEDQGAGAGLLGPVAPTCHH